MKLMMEYRFIANISLLLLLLTGKPLVAQNPLKESVTCFTDRSIYFAGEPIYLTIICSNSSGVRLSTVVYIELYDIDHKVYLQQKLQLTDGRANTSIKIPQELITGNYFLRAYTHYQRNFSPSGFCTALLKIINPELPPVKKIQSVEINSQKKTTDTSLIEVITDKKQYQAGEKAKIEITSHGLTNLTISIVKKGSFNAPWANLGKTGSYKDEIDTNTLRLKYYPEPRYVSVTGKVLSRGKAISNALVFASVSGEAQQFHISRTKTDGTFVFSLPHLAKRQALYLCAEKIRDKEIEIVVDSDFCTTFASFQAQPEMLDSVSKAVIREMYRNAEVKKYFLRDQEPQEKKTEGIAAPFNEKSRTTLLADYVAMSNLTEVLNEIVPYVDVKKEGARKVIKVFNTIEKQDFEKPILLLDNIPIQEDSLILNLPPQKIYSVEVLPEPYVYGNEMIAGLVNIKSVQGDFAGMELPPGFAVLEYLTINPENSIQEEQLPQLRKEHYPYCSNTLYWNPAVQLSEGRCSIDLILPNVPDEFEVIARGIDQNGQTIYSQQSFQVK